MGRCKGGGGGGVRGKGGVGGGVWGGVRVGGGGGEVRVGEGEG